VVKGLNRIMVIGQVGREPEMRYTADGRPTTTFGIVQPHEWDDEVGNRQTADEWFHVVAWGRLAEACKKCLSQGVWVYVQGRLQTRSWEDGAGTLCHRLELIAQDVEPWEDGALPAG
jgi:single-strand DNA-binding protein